MNEPIKDQSMSEQGAASGKSYTIDEYLALIKPTYDAYTEQIRQRISGLITYAGQQAAINQDEQLPMLRNLIMEMAYFWNLDGCMEYTAGMEPQYGGIFDQTVAQAREEGLPPAITDQVKQDILTGLGVHIQEMQINEDMEELVQRSDSLARQLQSEWQMEPAPSQQDTLTFMM